MYCFILAASYSGSLKAFLTLPVYEAPIDNLEDVIDSGLPWGMVDYIFSMLNISMFNRFYMVKKKRR